MRRLTAVLAVACVALLAIPLAHADTTTLLPEADTFVNEGTPTTVHGAETSFDVYAGAGYAGCGTGQSRGLLRFDLSSIPAGATITSATLSLQSIGGFAQDGDPSHYAVYLADDSWTEAAATWSNPPNDGLVRASPEWTIFGNPFSTSSQNLAATSAFENSGCGAFAPEPRDFSSLKLAQRIGAELTGDATKKLSLEIVTFPCGDGFAVPCANSGTFQSYYLRYLSRESGTLTAPRLVVTYDPPPLELEQPVIFRAVSTGPSSALVLGRVDGASNTALTLAATTSPTCVDGELGAGGPAGGPVSVTTDEDGYFVATVSGVPPGDFVTLAVTAPVTTDVSACAVTSGDNDFWPKALEITTTARDAIDAEGKARWYRIPITPGQRLEITLSELPADYDLAVFKDIGAEFASQLAPTTPTELTRLSAEYAPSVFSPSVFSPSVFSPSVFSPDAYAPSVFSPSVFSPSVFSPSVFSPSVFSPSVFSPSVFSPSVFSPSVFSPSVFSPSVFSPSVFSPSVFSPDEVTKAFSSAQTRSIVGVSATPGTGNETVVVNTWSSTGSFYVRVTGKDGAFDTTGRFRVTAAKTGTSCAGVTDTALSTRAATGITGLRTLILTDSSKVALGTTVPGGGTLATKLAAFAARPEIAGLVVDVAGDARVTQLKAQAAANTACPFAQNLVAGEIKTIVDAHRASSPGLAYVVIAGNDDAIPFFRYPDQSLLGQESGYVPPVRSDSASEASLRQDYVLGQDAYGASTFVSLRTTDLPIPGLAVGRLVETPAEMAGVIDAYGAVNGVAPSQRSLVTGYDFLEDAANAVNAEFQAGGVATRDTLITPAARSPQDPASWTATQLATALLGSRHDLVFLAGHFSANSALAADFTTDLLTSDLDASTVDLANTIVLSAGCHAGYNIVDGAAVPGVTATLDWAQAFARKRATLVAGTGYQYGDTDFLEYSERLYRNLARELRAGTGPVSVGEALVRAKLDYLETTPDLRGLHEKALLETVVFGLPMLSVNLPSGRGGSSGGGAGAITPVQVPSGPGATLGLRTADLAVSPGTTPRTLGLTNIQTSSSLTASWLQGPDGVVTNPAEPALPLKIENVTPTDASVVLRGVGFRGGTYADSEVVPLTGAPTTELRGVHVPFVSPVFFPMRIWTVNHFGTLGGSGGTNLLVTPAQHRSADLAAGTSVRRAYSSLDLRLFYSGSLGTVALSDAPTIVESDAVSTGGQTTFSALVVGDPKAAIHSVWVTYTTGGAWQSLDLAQCVAPLPAACGTTEDSRRWAAKLGSAPAGLRYVVQAVNGIGLVSLDDNRGAYYALETATPPAPVATQLALVSPPADGTFGGTATIAARLTKAGGDPVAGAQVTVTIGGSGSVGTTAADGSVSVSLPLVTTPGARQIVASYAGADGLKPSSTEAPFTIAKAATQLASLRPQLVVTPEGSSFNLTTLTATLGGKTQPLLQESVTFVLTRNGTSRTFVVQTDYLGRATLGPTGLAQGLYAVRATFGGNDSYLAASRTGALLILRFTGFFSPIANPPAFNTARAGRKVELKFSIGGTSSGDDGREVGRLRAALLVAGYPRAIQVNCTTGVPLAAGLGTSTTGTLGFDSGSISFTYTWETSSAFAGRCYEFRLGLVDGSERTARFRFT